MRPILLVLLASACTAPEDNFSDGGRRDGGGVACEVAGYAECDGDESALCETYVWADEASCGDCGTRCDGARLCVAGRCTDVVIEEAGLGAGHTCVRTTSQHVLCWGHNSRGQLGDGTYDDVRFTRDRADAVAVIELEDAVEIDVNGLGGCAIRGAARTVSCWGDNNPNRFGPISGAASIYTVPGELLGAEAPVREVSVGGMHVCVRTDAEVLCAGSNGTGALGRADSSVRTTLLAPMEGLPAGEAPVSIAAGGPGAYAHTCVAMTNGRVYCTGTCDSGQCGQSGVTGLFGAEEVPGLTDIVFVDAGNDFTCALDATGVVYCWGGNGSGQLGNGSVGGMNDAPQRVDLPVPIGAIAAGATFVLAVTAAEDEVWNWGSGDDGQLGRGAAALSDTGAPARVLGASGVRYEPAAGTGHACLVERRPGEAPRLLCAGSNRYFALGGLPDETVTSFTTVPAVAP